MELKIIPKNDPYLLDIEVSGNEKEILKFEEVYATTELKYIIFNLRSRRNNLSFSIIKQDLDVIKVMLKDIEKEIKKERGDNDGDQYK